MSRNFFGVLDDSDEEGADSKPAVAAPSKSEDTTSKSPPLVNNNTKAVVSSIKSNNNKSTNNQKSATNTADAPELTEERQQQQQRPPRDSHVKHHSRSGGPGRGGGGRGGRGHEGRRSDRTSDYSRGADDADHRPNERAPVRQGKRVYDRHSGSGRGKEVKKGGAGPRNWGSETEEARQAMADTSGVLDDDALLTEVSEVIENADVNNEVTTATDEVVDGDNGAEDEAVAEPEQPEPEPEDNTITYEEYLATKQAQPPTNELLAPVKEREVPNEFAHVKPAKTEEEDFLVPGAGKAKRTRQKTKEKKSLVPSFRVETKDSRSFRGSGRGRGRGSGDSRGGSEGDFRGGSGGSFRSGSGGPDVNSGSDGRGNSGGRGRGGERYGGRGGRGGRGRNGDGRGPRGSGRGGAKEEINVDDEQAFPSL